MERRIPQEVVTPVRRRELLATVFGILLVVAAGNALARVYLLVNPVNQGYAVVRAQWNRLLSLDPPADWVILGDSSGLHGVRGDVIHDRRGETAVNLSTQGNMTPIHSAWMLDKYLQTHPSPKRVVLVHVYDIWHRGDETLRLNLHHIPLPWGFWRRFEPAMRLDRSSVIHNAVAGYLPLYSQNLSVAHLLRHPSQLLENHFPEIDAFGYSPLEESNPGGVVADKNMHVREMKERRHFFMTANNRHALERMAELAARYEFELHLATSPIYEGLHETPVYREHLQAMLREYHAVAAGNDRVHVILERSRAFPAHLMENADHLIHPSAATYTRELIEAVEQAETAG